MWRGALLAAPLATPWTARAVVLGQADTFAGPALAGWSSGAGNPNPPVALAGGGPLGAADAFLQLAANGGAAGGRLVAFAGSQWNGDYASAGVSAIRMDLRNLGSTDLSLRLMIDGAGGARAWTPAVALAAGGSWTDALFPLLPGTLTGDPGALQGVTRLTLLHAPLPVFPPAQVVALLGVDNISAVPEPAAAGLWLAGLAGLAAWSGRSRRWRATGPAGRTQHITSVSATPSHQE